MIGLIGINYKSSTLDIREKFSLDESAIKNFGLYIKNKQGLSGLIVLSTCNRSEYYFRMQDCCDSGAFSFMLKSLKEFCNVTENVRDYFYFKSGENAYKHLFHVISGANSMIIGEDQIVGQVKQALKISIDNNLSDTELTRLFTKSFEVSKKIRTQTKINKGAFSVSYAGVEKCISVFNNIVDCNVLLIGAGETGALTLKSLLKKGCKNIVITNRTEERAVRLANKYKVKSVPFSSLVSELENSDIIIVSTASQKALITKEIAENTIAKTKKKKQLYIDLSVPRNVEHSVSSTENIIVFDVDDLQEVVNANQEKRIKLISEIDNLVNTYVDEYCDWLSTRNLSSVISKIKTNFSLINQKELSGFKKNNKSAETNLLDNYGSFIAEKYSRHFIKNLREVTQNGRKTEYIKVLSELFEIN
ncbi:MAG: glutamyl-tRNA reductase [Bacteroidales bacterium]|nr:glutamyl-tRNA reductase [Bacteroidales bacterium]